MLARCDYSVLGDFPFGNRSPNHYSSRIQILVVKPAEARVVRITSFGPQESAIFHHHLAYQLSLRRAQRLVDRQAWRALRLPRMSAAQLLLEQTLREVFAKLSWRHLGHHWQLVDHNRPYSDWRLLLQLDFSGRALWIAVDRVALGSLWMATSEADEPNAETSQWLELAIEEVTYSTVVGVGRALATHLSIVNIALAVNKPLTVPRHLLKVRVNIVRDEAPIACAELACEGHDLAFFRERLIQWCSGANRTRVGGPNEPAWTIPLALDCRLGYQTLVPDELANLERGDVLMVDGYDYPHIGVWIDRGNFCIARWQQDRLVVVSEWGIDVREGENFDGADYSRKQDEQGATHQGREAASTDDRGESADTGIELGEIELEVTFSVGRVMLDMAELRALRPGFVFELPRRAEHLVNIQISGQTIGVGELVEVDQRIGVRVVNLNNPNNGIAG